RAQDLSVGLHEARAGGQAEGADRERVDAALAEGGVEARAVREDARHHAVRVGLRRAATVQRRAPAEEDQVAVRVDVGVPELIARAAAEARAEAERHG